MTLANDRARAVRALIAAAPAASSQDLFVGLLHRVCVAACRSLSASGVGVSLMTEAGDRGLTAASDRTSQGVEDLQFTLGEGPCLEAFTARRPVLEPDLAAVSATRWPFYAQAAHEQGVRAVFAFPLQTGAARLGAIDVYRARPGPLSPDELVQALTFADVTLAALLDGQESRPAPDGEDPGSAYSSRVSQAQGMVSVQLGVGLAEAMARLRARAFADDRALADIARDVVARRLRLERDSG